MNISNIKDSKSIPNDNSNSEGKEKEKKEVYNNKNDSNRIFGKLEEPMVSLFENCFSVEPIRQIKLKSFLFSKKYKEQIEAYRRTIDEKTRQKLKQSFKCVTPSGTFSQRQAHCLITHSQLICIDIDNRDNRTIDWDKAKHTIGKHCPSLYYAGLSLGGKGMFLIFRISNPESHKQHYDALEYYLNKKYHLVVDKAVKSPVSLRVISYDENPYYNPNPVPFEQTIEVNDSSAHVVRTATERNKIRENVERATDIIWKNRIDITNQYADWFRIGLALAHEFGKEGRHWFHMISRMSEKYDECDCNIQYHKCLKYNTEVGVKIATFFYYCKEYGIRYWEK